jgi:hypothetical protein
LLQPNWPPLPQEASTPHEYGLNLQACRNFVRTAVCGVREDAANNLLVQTTRNGIGLQQYKDVFPTEVTTIQSQPAVR